MLASLVPPFCVMHSYSCSRNNIIDLWCAQFRRLYLHVRYVCFLSALSQTEMGLLVVYVFYIVFGWLHACILILYNILSNWPLDLQNSLLSTGCAKCAHVVDRNKLPDLIVVSACEHIYDHTLQGPLIKDHTCVIIHIKGVRPLL